MTSTAPPPVVEVDHVTRTFGATLALDDVSLRVGPGEMVGLLGPNGAGKTTLLSLVDGLRHPDSGTVRIFGGDPRHPASRTRLGTTPQETGLPATLRVAEVIDFVRRHYPDPVPTAELLETFGLTELARRQTGGLSGGQRRRLAVALALAGRPQLVLLDEPTTGLDVDARHVLWEALRAFHAQGVTVLVTSHYLEEIEALAKRVVVVDHGHLLADAPIAEVLGRVALRWVTFDLDLDLDLARAGFRALPGLVGHEVDPATGRHLLRTADADAVVRALVVAGVPFRGLEVRSASLEEAFLSLTAAAAAEVRP